MVAARHMAGDGVVDAVGSGRAVGDGEADVHDLAVVHHGVAHVAGFSGHLGGGAGRVAVFVDLVEEERRHGAAVRLCVDLVP